MALKDLVADRGKLTEEMIEKIVADYVRYDPEAYEIVLTPAGVALGNDAKVLVMLVAIMGWGYVVDEVRKVDSRPGDLEVLTGIHGGTLRPTLKKLKDAHLIAAVEGHYSVRLANLDAIAKAVSGEKTTVPPARRAKKDRKDRAAVPAAKGAQDAGPFDKGKRRPGVPIRASLARLVEQGFFSEARILSQVVDRLHEQAIIAKATSLSGPIAELVREGKLERKKTTEGNKELWGYKAV